MCDRMDVVMSRASISIDPVRGDAVCPSTHLITQSRTRVAPLLFTFSVMSSLTTIIPILATITLLLVVVLPPCDAFVSPNDTHGPRLVSPHTQRHAFLWFGGSEPDNDEHEKIGKTTDGKDLAVAATLTNVAAVMEAMGSFKASQRVGERATGVLQELQDKEQVEGSAANGKIKVLCNGQQRPTSVHVDETYLQDLVRDRQPKEAAKDLSAALLLAMTDAHAKSSARLNERLKTVYSDMGFDT
jgi:DNA-binding protein YbaB